MVKGKSNPVAKFSKQFNKGGPMRDRKKDDKRGYQKHKKQYKEDDQQTDTTGHTNAAARRPQNYVDPETGKTKTRMVPVHRDVQNEKLNPSDGIKAYIDDFKKSDAPQFKGKSDAKKKEMAIAAYLDAKRGAKKEACWTGYRQAGMKKKGDKVVPNCVPENYRAARAQSNAANKMYGRTSDPIDKKPASAAKKPSGLDSKGRMIRDKNPAATRRAMASMSKSIAKKYGTKKEDVDKAQLKLKHAKEKERLKTKHAREKEMASESMNPRDFTDKPGHVVVVTKPSGHKSIKHYNASASGAKKYADRVNKVNKVGHKATVHKTDGRKIHEEIEMRELQELSPTTHKSYQQKAKKSVDKLQTKYTNAQIANRASKSSMNKLDKKIDRRHAGISKSMDKHEGVDRGFGSRMKAADAAANSYSKTKRKPENDTIRAIRLKHKQAAKKTNEALSPMDQVKLRNLKRRVKQGDKTAAKQLAAFQKSKEKDIKLSKSTAAKAAPANTKGDAHIVMQLRKAQDVGGNMDLKVSPAGKKVRLSKGQIDSLLKKHDGMSKPRDKRMFRVQLTRKLRGMAK